MRRSIVVTLGATVFLFLALAGAAQAVKVEQWNVPGGKYVNRKDEFPVDLVHGHLVTNVVLPTGYNSRSRLDSYGRKTSISAPRPLA